MVWSISALELRYTVWCISIGGTIFCVLYQLWRCDILCALSALELPYTVCYISIGFAIYCVVYQHRRCDTVYAVSS